MKSIPQPFNLPERASAGGSTFAGPGAVRITPARTRRIPPIIKLAYTGFMAVLVPVYWARYGPTNFLYFCDVALFLTLIGVWWEKPIFASMAAVGILLPQAIWLADFIGNFGGVQLTGMTDYMFDGGRSLFLRGLSLFHGWLPLLLLFLVWRLGYDRRALWAWTVTAWTLVLVSYFLLPGPGEVLANPLAPRNINYVHGFSETAAQAWMPGRVWLVALMGGLLVALYLPTHMALRKWFPQWQTAPGSR